MKKIKFSGETIAYILGQAKVSAFKIWWIPISPTCFTATAAFPLAKSGAV